MPDVDDAAAAELRELYLVRQEYLMGMHATASQAGTDRWTAVVDRYDALLTDICRRRGVPVPRMLNRCFTVEQRRDVEARFAAAGFDFPFPAP